MPRIAAATVVGFILALSAPLAAAEPVVLDVWPGKAPGDVPGIGDEKVLDAKPGEKLVKRITNITRPTLSVFRPAKDKDTGAVVVIAPGGGYNILAWDLEGEEVAAWLNTIGVTGVVLKYRVPRRPDNPKGAPPPQALMDAQRAISLVRSKAGEWGADPKRIGMLGFSAGGHLTAWTSTNFDKRSYAAVDDVDKVSCRPDFAVLVYPGGITDREKDTLSPEITISKDVPPMCFVHAADDRVKAENSLVMTLALRKVGVPAEVHLYASGGHGFGLRPSEHPASTWPQRVGEWMRNRGVLGPASATGGAK